MEEKDTKETSIENVEKNTTEESTTTIEQNQEINQENQNQKETENNKKQKNTAGKILGILGKTVLWSIIAILIIILIRALVFKKYDVFGYRFYLIMSGSMEPTINVSDAVITKEIDNPQEGDIIAFQYGSSITVHRIIKTYTQETGEKLYQTQGDNNNAIDSGLRNKSDIKGKVIYRVPKVGDAIIFIQRNIVIILILIVGIAIIITLVRRLI